MYLTKLPSQEKEEKDHRQGNTLYHMYFKQEKVPIKNIASQIIIFTNTVNALTKKIFLMTPIICYLDLEK